MKAYEVSISPQKLQIIKITLLSILAFSSILFIMALFGANASPQAQENGQSAEEGSALSTFGQPNQPQVAGVQTQNPNLPAGPINPSSPKPSPSPTPTPSPSPSPTPTPTPSPTPTSTPFNLTATSTPTPTPTPSPSPSPTPTPTPTPTPSPSPSPTPTPTPSPTPNPSP